MNSGERLTLEAVALLVATGSVPLVRPRSPMPLGRNQLLPADKTPARTAMVEEEHQWESQMEFARHLAILHELRKGMHDLDQVIELEHRKETPVLDLAIVLVRHRQLLHKQQVKSG